MLVASTNSYLLKTIIYNLASEKLNAIKMKDHQSADALKDYFSML